VYYLLFELLIALSVSFLTFTSNLQPIVIFLPDTIPTPNYARYYSFYSDCLQRHRLLSTTLLVLSKGFVMNRLILSFKMIFGRYQHIVKKYCVACLQMTRDDIGH